MQAILFHSNVVFIHVGIHFPEQMKIFTGLLEKYNYHELTYKIIFREGDIQKVIWEVCAEEKIDLLISGALRKEPLNIRHLGSISRGLARNPKGPVMLVPEPQLPAKPVKKIIISVEDANPEQVIEAGLFFARYAPGCKLYFVKESVLKTEPGAIKQFETEQEYREAFNKLLGIEKKYVDGMLALHDTEGMEIDSQIVFGDSGTGLVDFARKIDADVIIDAHPDIKHRSSDRLLPREVENLLFNLPCRLLLFG